MRSKYKEFLTAGLHGDSTKTLFQEKCHMGVYYYNNYYYSTFCLVPYDSIYNSGQNISNGWPGAVTVIWIYLIIRGHFVKILDRVKKSVNANSETRYNLQYKYYYIFRR